jgi:hypothetical protein
MSQGISLAEIGGPRVANTRESSEPLLTPYRMGDLDLPNRVIMAPLTRMRANPDDHVPTGKMNTEEASKTARDSSSRWSRESSPKSGQRGSESR